MRRKVAVTAGVVIAVLLVVLQASEPTPSEAYSGPCTNGTSISATSGRELLRPCEHTTAKCTSWTRAGTCDGYARYVKLCEYCLVDECEQTEECKFRLHRKCEGQA